MSYFFFSATFVFPGVYESLVEGSRKEDRRKKKEEKSFQAWKEGKWKREKNATLRSDSSLDGLSLVFSRFHSLHLGFFLFRTQRAMTTCER